MYLAIYGQGQDAGDFSNASLSLSAANSAMLAEKYSANPTVMRRDVLAFLKKYPEADHGRRITGLLRSANIISYDEPQTTKGRVVRFEGLAMRSAYDECVRLTNIRTKRGGEDYDEYDVDLCMMSWNAGTNCIIGVLRFVQVSLAFYSHLHHRLATFFIYACVCMLVCMRRRSCHPLWRANCASWE